MLGRYVQRCHAITDEGGKGEGLKVDIETVHPLTMVPASAASTAVAQTTRPSAPLGAVDTVCTVLSGATLPAQRWHH